MPFRRRPPEPSPRLRALLEGAGRDRGAPAAWVPPEPRERPLSAGRHRRPPPSAPTFLTLPQSLHSARLSGPRAATVGLVALVALAIACFGVRLAWARAESQPRVVAPGRTGSAVAAQRTGTAEATAGTDRGGSSGFASSPTASGGGGPPSTASGTVTVHVVGQVKRPGVLRLASGSRVADAVTAAGGVRSAADPSAINLARVLVDGEQIRVPKVGEVPVVVPGQAGADGAQGSSGGTGPGAGGPVNLNTASVIELDSLPGVGPVLAQRIVDWRTEHGRFASVDELGEVSGIGEKIFAQLRPKVTV